jgi:hypothetical protein
MESIRNVWGFIGIRVLLGEGMLGVRMEGKNECHESRRDDYLSLRFC